MTPMIVGVNLKIDLDTSLYGIICKMGNMIGKIHGNEFTTNPAAQRL